MSATIPASHLELLTTPVYTVLTTLMKDGHPQSTVVWCDYDGEYIRINSNTSRQKDKNLRRDPRVTLLVLDPQNPYYWMEVRGEVAEITEEGAKEHIESLSWLYEGKKFYGGYAAAEREHTETRVMYKIRPLKVYAYGEKGSKH